MNEIVNNKVNLCDSCSQTYPGCTSKPENVYFGDGIGHDNICACSEYQPFAEKTQLSEESTTNLQPTCNKLATTQPEKRTEERTETHACDCVSGVAAIIAAIEAVDEWDGGYNVQRANMIRDAIKALPSAQPQWIPVTDRLPEESKEVLICTDDGLLYIAEHEYLFDRVYWEETTEYRTVENVVAWMPLPESYKGEQG